MTRQISVERKAAYYLGMVLMVAGLMLFLSVFVTGAMHFGDFEDFDARARSSMLRGFGGMALMILGQILRRTGARGLAGSGVVLDPEQARKELEPFSRMGGGMVRDALDEAQVDLRGRPEKVIMVKCPGCARLNEEDSRFCQECGRKV